jgi:hypothetical protein
MDTGVYTLMSPHSDRFRVTDAPVEGYRHDWEARMIAAAPTTKRELAGYLSALYQLRNEAEPPAYLRSTPVYRFQLRIERIIGTILAQHGQRTTPTTADEVLRVERTR